MLAPSAQRGFTLVELVSVIALVGVLSAVAFARFADSDSYRQSAFAGQLHSYLRLAQQLALSQQGQQTLLRLQRADAHWQLSIDSGAHVRDYTLQGAPVLRVDGQPLASAPLTLRYDDSGELVGLSSLAKAPVRSVEIALASHFLCLSPSGYSYAGHCR